MTDKLTLKNYRSQEYIPIGKDSDKTLKRLIIPNSEIIKVEDKIIQYPCDHIDLGQYAFKNSQMPNHEKDPRKPNSTDKLLKISTLFPPIIVNLRMDAKPGKFSTRDQLTNKELEYLRQKGGVSILFIHGFNVAFGDYSQQIIGIKNSESQVNIDPQSSIDSSKYILERSESLNTIARSQAMLESNFNHAAPLNFRIPDEEMNGYAAHNWFVHMENNINIASGALNNQDYSSYLRLIHIAWPGDVPTYEYLNAEEMADQAGKRLVKLIFQLYKENIEINIIAHSLGARVALNSMQILAENNIKAIKQVFLWQAAVPNYALSNDPSRDHSVKNNDHFPSAHLSTQKITVLYSKNDSVLAYYYFLINRIGLTPKEFLLSNEKWNLFYRYMDKNPLEILASAELLKSDLGKIAGLKINSSELDLFIRLLKEIYRFSKISPALGYHGPDLKDPFIHKLIEKGQLILVDQPRLQGHSAMKIPDQEMMDTVYKRWIVNKKYGVNIPQPKSKPH